MTLEDCWETVLLDRSRNSIAGKLDVLHHDGMETSILKLSNRVKTNVSLLSDFKGSDAKNVRW
jgi:hypothetical protein